MTAAADQAPATDPGGEHRRRIEDALAAEPGNPALHRALAAAVLPQDELTAQVHLITAEILETHAQGRHPDAPVDLCNIANAYFARGNYRSAELWYRIVLELAPHFAIAHMNLVSIYKAWGRLADAERCRDNAYRRQRVFIETDGAAPVRVLLLNSGRGAGNIPTETRLPLARYQRIGYIVDYAGPDEDRSLPAYDVVFNAIGEPDSAWSLRERLAQFARTNRRPLLNDPQQVARTQRHRLAELLPALDGVIVPACVKIDKAGMSGDELGRLLAEHRIAYPLLYRPAGSHGGQGLVRCDSKAALAAAIAACPGEAGYLSAFHDCRQADGHYRKYRIIYIDRRPYPYHLAISPHWLVHYETAGMADAPWRIAEERAFLADPGAVLGPAGLDAIAAIGRAFDLDYCGIDFTRLPSGELLVFEANASMLIHMENATGELAHKNAGVQRIVDAFADRIGAATADGPAG